MKKTVALLTALALLLGVSVMNPAQALAAEPTKEMRTYTEPMELQHSSPFIKGEVTYTQVDEYTIEFEAKVWDVRMRASMGCILTVGGQLTAGSSTVSVTGNMAIRSDSTPGCSLTATIYRNSVTNHGSFSGSGSYSASTGGSKALTTGTHAYSATIIATANGDTVPFNTDALLITK